MKSKRKIFMKSKRTSLRKFIDLINELNIFEEKIEYPVYHKGKYEENNKIEYIENVNKYIIIKGDKFIEKNIDQIKKKYAYHYRGHFDFNYKLHFKDDLKKICPSKNISKKKEEFKNYLLNKFKTLKNVTLDNRELFEIKDNNRNMFAFIVIDDHNPKYIYRFYFGIDIYMSKSKNNEKNYCEFSMPNSTFEFNIYY